MTDSISIEEATDIISSAFKPFECSVEVYDHGSKVRFRVWRDTGVTIRDFEDISVNLVTEPQRLYSFLQWARSQAQTQVASLDPWEFPEIE